MFTRLDRPLTAALGLMFLASGHRYGWPVAEGGSGSIIAALAAALSAHGGTITTGVTVTSRSDIPDADIVMLDLSPAAALSIYGDRHARPDQAVLSAVPRGILGVQGRLRHRGRHPVDEPRLCTRGHGPSRRDVRRNRGHRTSTRTRQDGATAIRARRAAVPGRPVPLGGQHQPDMGLRARAVRLHRRRHRRRRRPDRAVRAGIPRPHHRDREQEHRRASRPTTPTTSAATSSGAPTTGCRSSSARGWPSNPYATGVPGVYLCSQSTPPGAGIHGLCGYHAAASALRWLHRRSGG